MICDWVGGGGPLHGRKGGFEDVRWDDLCEGVVCVCACVLVVCACVHARACARVRARVCGCCGVGVVRFAPHRALLTQNFCVELGGVMSGTRQPDTPHVWSNTGHMLVKYWSNAGQARVKHGVMGGTGRPDAPHVWSNTGQITAK